MSVKHVAQILRRRDIFEFFLALFKLPASRASSTLYEWISAGTLQNKLFRCVLFLNTNIQILKGDYVFTTQQKMGFYPKNIIVMYLLVKNTNFNW